MVDLDRDLVCKVDDTDSMSLSFPHPVEKDAAARAIGEVGK